MSDENVLKQVFGPVPSRRLGKSLGIDPVPLKTCNWNCVYCQLGRTKKFETERKHFYSEENIIEQLNSALRDHQPGEIDWITFVGSGETMLNLSVGSLIEKIKQITTIPIAIITNGSLLSYPEVRWGLLNADAVLPTLDAGNAELFKKINRPHPKFTFEKHVDGLISFRNIYKGALWVEVMLIRDMNDSNETMEKIALIMDEINPDEIHIVQPNRPPVENWVQPSDEEGIMRALAILGKKSKVIRPISGVFDLGGYDNPIDAVIGIITRHPMREEELIESLTKWSSEDVTRSLASLEAGGKAQRIMRYGLHFWTAEPGVYEASYSGNIHENH